MSRAVATARTLILLSPIQRCWARRPLLPHRSPALERLKDRARVQPWSAVAWDDPRGPNTDQRYRGRRAMAVRIGGRDRGGEMELGAAGGTGNDHRGTGLGRSRAPVHEH